MLLGVEHERETTMRSIMKKVVGSRRKVAALVTTLLLGLGAVGLTATSASALVPVRACPVGYVCMYTPAQWNACAPYASRCAMSASWYSYGTYNFTNRYGDYYIFNNQTLDRSAPGPGRIYLCSGYNGTGKVLVSLDGGGMYVRYNMTPVNSIKVTPN